MFLKIPFVILKDIFNFFIVNMPGSFGVKIRYYYYKNKFKNCGKNLIIDVGVHIEGFNLISIGDNVYIDKYCIISTGNKLIGNITYLNNNAFKGEKGEIIIGNNIHITQYCILMGYGGIKLADNVVLSANSKIYSHTNTAYNLKNRHEVISLMPYNNAPFLNAPVVINKNVWLGINTIVMPNVFIDANSFVVTNSVVMNSFQENSYISGQPAKMIKNRFKI